MEVPHLLEQGVAIVTNTGLTDMSFTFYLQWIQLFYFLFCVCTDIIPKQTLRYRCLKLKDIVYTTIVLPQAFVSSLFFNYFSEPFNNAVFALSSLS